MNDLQQALVTAYLMGAKAKAHTEMVAAIKLSRQLETGLSSQQIAQAKLQAEMELEPMRGYHLPNE